MKEIIFYDSGVGGIALLNKTKALCKRENFLYFADNANMPYGNKPQKEVLNLVISNLNSVVTSSTKCVVIACNTITSQSISHIRYAFPNTPIFGIEPEIKQAENPNMKNLLLIATPQTCDVQRERIANLGYFSKITIHTAYNLAKTIENNITNKEVIYREIKKIKHLHGGNFQGVILGCTHYALVKDLFIYAFGGEVQIFDGIDGTANNISKTIKKQKSGFGSVKLHLSKDTISEKLKYVRLIN